MVLYKITNLLNNKVYVGQTTRPLSHRWTQHLRDSVCFDYPLYRAIRKYGVENFKCEELLTANSIEELNKAEQQFINDLNTTNRYVGYNILPGGQNWKMPEEVKQKISKALKGKKFKQHISKEKRSKIARENAKKAFSEDKLEKWAVLNGSRPFKVYKAVCKQFRKRNQPSIYEKGEFIGQWLLTTECAKDLQINYKHIGSCLNKNRKQSHGYIFEIIEEGDF
jgi:group I intron endonuclease